MLEWYEITAFIVLGIVGIFVVCCFVVAIDMEWKRRERKMNIKKILGYFGGSQRSLRQIRRNLNQIAEEAERREYAVRAFERLIAVLHDMNEEDNTRRMRNLRVAASLKNEYHIPLSDYALDRLRQFYANSAHRNTPKEGFVLIKFLLAHPERDLDDFLRSESAKVAMDEFEYSAEVDSMIRETKRVFSAPRRNENNDGFDPLNPKTWKK